MSFAFSASLTAILSSGSLLLAGCASLDHPHGWGSNPEKRLSNGCPDLSGTYSTRPAESYPGNAGPLPFLNEILGPGGLSKVYKRDKPWPVLPHATTASLTTDGNWLNVRFRDDAGGVADLTFKRKFWWGGSVEGADAMFHCQQLEQGSVLGIEAAQHPGFATQYPVSKPDAGMVFLSKGQDGSLIINYKILSADIAPPFLFIVRGQGSMWWRYPPSVSNQ